MGNQSNVPQGRRHQDDPVICCGEQQRRDPQDQASAKVMNLDKNTYSRFGKENNNSDKNYQNANFEQTGSTYYKQKDVTIFRKPGNSLEYSTYNKQANYQMQNENTSKDSKDVGALRPITQLDNQNKKSGFASFKKPGYGAFNGGKNGHNTFNSYGMHTSKDKDLKQNIYQIKDLSNHKPTPVVDFVGQKQIKQEIKQQKAKSQSAFIGQGKYGGRSQQFSNNKRMIMFLQQNYIKEPQFKFYDTKDESSLMNNSTIRLAKKKHGKIQQKYLDQNSNSNLRVNQTLAKLQQPIQLNLQIDAKIILATCLLIIAIVIVSLGATVFYSDINFFICLMIAIILYVCYILICYIYNDIIEYFTNVRSFSQFEQDYKKFRQINGQLAYHIHSQTPRKTIKQCYLLSKQNKFTKVQFIENQNRDISVDQLVNKNVSFLMVRYKTKTAFMDPQSQLNTINYFDAFLQQHKESLQQQFGKKKQSNKQTKKSSIRQATKSKSKKQNERVLDQKQRRFKDTLVKSDFGYQLPPIEGISSKPSQVFNVCYVQDDDSGCTITLFVIFTLLGLCLPFLLIFQAYAKRYRINILNRFKVGQGKDNRR